MLYQSSKKNYAHIIEDVFQLKDLSQITKQNVKCMVKVESIRKVKRQSICQPNPNA
jgi:hypothetical protein